MNKEHILVVEDNDAIRYTVVHVLNKVGYQVSQARDGEEGLSMILRANAQGDLYDLLLTDLQMPRMNGFELIRAIRDKDIALPVFVMSGVMDAEMFKKIEARDCSGFLEKPFELGNLVVRVRAVLEEKDGARTPGYRPKPSGAGVRQLSPGG